MSKERAYQYFQRVIRLNYTDQLERGIFAAKLKGFWDVNELIDSESESFGLIHLAAQFSPESLLTLRREGANLNLQNSRGETPLIISAKSGNHESCIYLLENGADIDLKASGKTAFDYAIESRVGEKVALEIFSRGIRESFYTDRMDILRIALTSNKIQLSSRLIDSMDNIFSPEEDGGIFRQVVEKLFDPSIRFPITTIRGMFKKYIQAKITSDPENKAFWEASNDIANHNNEALQQKILSGSVRIGMTIRSGFCLVTFAAIFNNEGAFFNREISMPLIDWSKADIDYRDMLGHTPAEWASRAEERGMLEALAVMGASLSGIEIDESWMSDESQLKQELSPLADKTEEISSRIDLPASASAAASASATLPDRSSIPPAASDSELTSEERKSSEESSHAELRPEVSPDSGDEIDDGWISEEREKERITRSVRLSFSTVDTDTSGQVIHHPYVVHETLHHGDIESELSTALVGDQDTRGGGCCCGCCSVM